MKENGSKISHSKTQTPGHQSSSSKVPNLMITQLHRSIGEQEDNSNLMKVDLLKTFKNPSANLQANTDRNVSEQPQLLGNQEDSQHTSRANDNQNEEPASINQALIVPPASYRRK